MLVIKKWKNETREENNMKINPFALKFITFTKATIAKEFQTNGTAFKKIVAPKGEKATENLSSQFFNFLQQKKKLYLKQESEFFYPFHGSFFVSHFS